MNVSKNEVFYRSISLKYSDFIQTNYTYTKKTLLNSFSEYRVENYEKITDEEKWIFEIKSSHGNEIIGDYFRKIDSTQLNFKIESEKNFIFWRKKTILDFYSFEGSTHFLDDKNIYNLLNEFKSEGVEITKIDDKIHFRFFINYDFDDHVFEKILILIQVLSVII